MELYHNNSEAETFTLCKAVLGPSYTACVLSYTSLVRSLHSLTKRECYPPLSKCIKGFAEQMNYKIRTSTRKFDDLVNRLLGHKRIHLSTHIRLDKLLNLTLVSNLSLKSAWNFLLLCNQTLIKNGAKYVAKRTNNLFVCNI